MEVDNSHRIIHNEKLDGGAGSVEDSGADSAPGGGQE